MVKTTVPQRKYRIAAHKLILFYPQLVFKHIVNIKATVATRDIKFIQAEQAYYVRRRVQVYHI
jgi:hypothetical protein